MGLPVDGAPVLRRRSIIIIADHKTQHVPFSVSTQLFGTISVLAVVIWVSYSTGSYMAAKRVLVEKDRTIATTTLRKTPASKQNSPCWP